MNDWNLMDAKQQKEAWDLYRFENGKYLIGYTFVLKDYTPIEKGNDHDHCELCLVKFFLGISNCLIKGYLTFYKYKNEKERAVWVCKECFNDFSKKLKWTVGKVT